MSVSGFRPSEPTDDLYVGNVREDAEVEAAKDDKDGDTLLTKEEVFVGSANRQPAGTRLPKFEAFKPGVPREHELRPLTDKELSDAVKANGGYGLIGSGPGGAGWFSARDLVQRSQHIGDFNVDGMGFGNARFSRQTVGGRDVSTMVLDMGGFDQGMLLDKDTKIRFVVAPRAFGPDATDRLGKPDAVILPCHVDVTGSAYSRAGFMPGASAAFAAVDTDKLRALSEGGKDLSFYVEIEAKGHPKRFANLDGKAFQNFTLPVDLIR